VGGGVPATFPRVDGKEGGEPLVFGAILPLVGVRDFPVFLSRIVLAVGGDGLFTVLAAEEDCEDCLAGEGPEPCEVAGLLAVGFLRDFCLMMSFLVFTVGVCSVAPMARIVPGGICFGGDA
jgi:hypothetical protein